MRATLFVKVAALVFLAVTASIATSMFMTHTGLARAARPPDATPPETRTVIKAGPPLARDQQAPQAGRRSIAGGAVKSMNVEVTGGTAHVAATAFIRDTRPNMRFIWAVRVIDPADETSVLFEKLYEDQIFGLPEQQERHATFEDRLAIPLGAGEYLLELTWFAIHPQSGLAGLEDDVVRRRFKGASGVAPITLNP